MPLAPRGPGASRPPGKSSPHQTWSTEQWQGALPPLLASLSCALPPEQQARLAQYMVLLAHWNATYNLTALRDAPDMLSHHLADCLAVLAPLSAYLARTGGTPSGAPVVDGEKGPLRLLDVGSGGGLPGVVLAICCPQVQVTCVDAVGKKAAFIRQVAAELRLPNLKAEHARVEALKGRYDLIASRAFASLADFVKLTQPLLAPTGVWMAMKGKPPTQEQQALPSGKGGVTVLHVEQLQVPGLDAERCLVWLQPITQDQG